ncbi:hypothetical protein BASA62_009374 [Batrachochytrium salamandrivorans]|nr:hypothetical protein BASA62_009374 [Batrachochytrium salamandrivorans]
MARSCMPTSSSCATTPRPSGSRCGVMLPLARSSRPLISPTMLRTRSSPVPRRDPTEGFSMVSNPEIKGSSPNGWTDGKATEGNNAITKTISGKTTSSTSDNVFDTKFNGDEEPRTDDNIAASAVNLFYLTNVMHDITYQYGFTEKAGNFQKDNFGKGGQGNDAVVLMFKALEVSTTPTSSLP